jgi:phytoene desaturase
MQSQDMGDGERPSGTRLGGDRSKEVVIIGAGPGGLASALLLAHAGVRVRIVERLPHVGGRTSSFTEQGFRFALGPTVFIQPEVIKSIFSAIGRRLEDEVELVRVDPMYRITFGSKGGSILCSGDKERMREAIREIAPADVEHLDRYFAENKQKLALMKPVMENPAAGFWDWIKVAKSAHILRPWNSLDQDLRRYFSDERIRRAFSFHAKYFGMSPFRTPGIFSVLAFMEYDTGVWHPIGGCAAVTEAMARVAREMGVTISLNEGVEAIEFEGRRAVGVKTNQGEYACDKLVINADFARAMTRLVPDEIRRDWTDAKIAKKKFSCSTFMVYLGIEGTYDDLAHHNVYIPDDYEKNLREVEDDHVAPSDPCFYVENACVTDPTLAPKGMSTLYTFASVTHEHANIDWRKEAPAFRDLLVSKFANIGIRGLEKRIRYERVLTPRDWSETYEVHNGAVYNLQHTLTQLLSMRPRNRFTELEEVYLVGGGTHPGSGLPVIFQSARITSRLMLQDWGMDAGFIDETPPIAEPVAELAAKVA